MNLSATHRKRLALSLASADVSWDEVTECRALDGGTFNAVYRIALVDGRELVVKLAPDPTVPTLRYERGILRTEAWFYRTVREATSVPVPEAFSRVTEEDEVLGEHLTMSACPGTPWGDLGNTMDVETRDRLRAELGAHVAALHTITGSEGFGYPAKPWGSLRAGWREAFLDMVGAVLDDAERFGAVLPRPADEIRSLFARRSPVLEEVNVPRLVHFDLWDGNILVDRSPDGPVIGALIDAERAFWGDPLADFVSLALFNDIEQEAALLNGYREAGGTVVLDASARERLALYRAYLHLIMWVEAVPRQFDAQHRAWLEGQVHKPLVATFDDWSRGEGASTA